ncbi:SMP-30/gluconolactonase/LRE family protein [Rhizorhapis suberifaciens]|uniref:Sugar lactone lactonase YvrE n=1 Tax=Rhizorhapis suberifaciens TaxID=13656 RepID=A0A840HVD8_9SPHN|nr:SMP-30/gluconolactonase/LRE family protein [Rhizorhapis suberifaciens]MBB4641549.1 sugar lactone lactonase YvrE [Rhizorhapis suberifaciens]
MVTVVPGSGHSVLGEGPIWSEERNAVFWTDILGKRLNRLSLEDGTVTGWNMPEAIGWVIERANHPGLLVGLASGFADLDLDPFDLRPFHDPEPDKPGNRMNDAKADSHGRIWCGTMPFDWRGAGASGSLYRLDPDRNCARVDGPYTIPNGPAIDRADAMMFHTDTMERIIYRIDIHSDGSLGPRKPHIIFDEDWGLPDGMTFDADGCLWVAHWGTGQVSRFDPDGRRERAIRLPASQITSMVFAGADLDRMFVTSAAENVSEEHGGALFEVDPGCRGLPTLKFGG